MNIRITLWFILLFASGLLTAQSKKDIRQNKIDSETVYVTIIKDGKELTYKDTYTVYDKNGNIIEKTEYYEDGIVKRREINAYDSEKNKILEEVYDGKEKKTRKTSFLYNNYNEKTGEIEYDENGNVLRQSILKYDVKGLRTEKQTYSGNKQLISIKKHVYTYR